MQFYCVQEANKVQSNTSDIQKQLNVKLHVLHSVANTSGKERSGVI